MEKQKKATRGQIGRIMAMLTSGQIPFIEAQAIIERNSARLSERPMDEYNVFVDYQMPHDKAKLESEFPGRAVPESFYGNREWQLHSSCAGIDQTPGSRVMMLYRFGRITESEANIIEMDALGYRPATHLEAYAFIKANPEFPTRFFIAALGSSVQVGVRRVVAVLGVDNDGLILGHEWFTLEWNNYVRFLFVRK